MNPSQSLSFWQSHKNEFRSCWVWVWFESSATSMFSVTNNLVSLVKCQCLRNSVVNHSTITLQQWLFQSANNNLEIEDHSTYHISGKSTINHIAESWGILVFGQHDHWSRIFWHFNFVGKHGLEKGIQGWRSAMLWCKKLSTFYQLGKVKSNNDMKTLFQRYEYLFQNKDKNILSDQLMKGFKFLKKLNWVFC